MARTPISTLARVREQRGLTQRELGTLIGVSASTVSAIENKHVRPWPRFRRQASRVLDVAEDQLFLDIEARDK